MNNEISKSSAEPMASPAILRLRNAYPKYVEFRNAMAAADGRPFVDKGMEHFVQQMIAQEPHVQDRCLQMYEQGYEGTLNEDTDAVTAIIEQYSKPLKRSSDVSEEGA